MNELKHITSMFSTLTLAFLMGFLAASNVISQSYMIDIKRDSARSDKRTGGVIEKADFVVGESDIRITVNVPAFQMTLWQNGKEIKNYPVGVGMKNYPIYVGRRNIKHIIYNPVWIPPHSDWVAPSLRGVTIKPTDPRNPLGKVKIPLGYGYLLHQAKGTQDLGNLVSHGCVRVLRNDLYDLSEKVIAAHSLPVSSNAISVAKRTKRTLVVELEENLPIEITYDTIVVEAGKLRIYPDVYSFKKNTVANLREELSTNKIDTSDIPDETLAQMLSRAKAKKQYVVNLDQLRSSGYLSGKVVPVLDLPRPKRKRKRRRR